MLSSQTAGRWNFMPDLCSKLKRIIYNCKINTTFLAIMNIVYANQGIVGASNRQMSVTCLFCFDLPKSNKTSSKTESFCSGKLDKFKIISQWFILVHSTLMLHRELSI